MIRDASGRVEGPARRRWAVLLAGGMGLGTLVAPARGIAQETIKQEPIRDEKPAPAGPKPERLTPEGMQRVKAATVLVIAEVGDDSIAQGSGFFCQESGVVCTNAHVLAMLRPGSPPPRRIQVRISSGEPDERTFPAEILGVDREHDLAILRVDGGDLPEPLTVASAATLREFDDLYVYGFPLALQFGAVVSGSKTSLTRLDRDARRGVVRLRVGGAIAPGNSGGPVVDNRGQVVGISTDRVRDEPQIARAVAGDVLLGLLHGRVVELSLGQPFGEGEGKARAPVTLRLLDPLDKVRNLSVACWPGPMLDEKEARAHPPEEPAPDDPRRRSVALTVLRATPEARLANDDLDPRHLAAEPGEFRATADLPLPPIEGGECYWMQPAYTDGGGVRRRWVASRWDAASPVERKTAALALKLRPGQASLVTLRSHLTAQIRGPKVNEGPVDYKDEVQCREAVDAVASSGFADLSWRFLAMNIERSAGGKPLKLPEPLARALPHVPDQVVRVALDRRNAPPDSKKLPQFVDRGGIPADLADPLRAACFPAVSWLRVFAIPLPGGPRNFDGKPWNDPARETERFSLEGIEGADLGLVRLRAKYLGRRQVDKIDQALIEIGGRFLIERPGQTAEPRGKVEGLVTLNLATGQVAEANLALQANWDRVLEGVPHEVTASLKIQLRRDPIEPETP